jgi:histidyl-tRNA synthetase
LGEYVSFDPKVIRGFDYYTGIVFEARKNDNSGRAILGGGHYDNLVSDVGGEPLPGVGFAMGDIMIRVVLEELGLIPAFSESPADILVTLFDENSVDRTFVLAQEIRNAGLKVVSMPAPQKLQKQMKYADRYGIPYVIIEGPEELQAGTVVVKSLKTGEQEIISTKNLGETIKKFLAEHPAL